MNNRPTSYSPLFHWVLRISAVMCFVGHGAFGIRTKAAWLPYFASFGVGESAAYRLMPIIGTVDILIGISVLMSPCRAVLLYMFLWAVFTALLRPIAGEGWWEALERAGNYGVPMAFLAMSGWPRSWRGWFDPIVPRPEPEPDSGRIERTALFLRVTTGLLLMGHGGFGAFMHSEMLAAQYWSAGLSALPLGLGTLVQGIGWFELMLGALVLAAPLPPLLLFIFGWKIATESLYPISGEPFWEFIERGGSYGAPLALFFIMIRRASPALVPRDARAPAEGSMA